MSIGPIVRINPDIDWKDVVSAGLPQRRGVFPVPKLKEVNSMIPQTLGDALDILTGLYPNNNEEVKRVHDEIKARVVARVLEDGLMLELDERGRYVLAPRLDRRIGK